MLEKDRDEMKLSFEKLRQLARVENKYLKCLGYDKTISPDDHELKDEVTLNIFSRCVWILVDRPAD